MDTQTDDNSCLYTLQFADNQIMCPNGKEDLGCMARQLQVECERWGLVIIMEKTLNPCVGEEITDQRIDNNKKSSTCKICN